MSGLFSKLQINNKKCIAVCGSGGKSTVCFSLAKEALADKKRTAITTTTHIGIPKTESCILHLSENPQELKTLLRSGRLVVSGRIQEGKLCYGGDEQFLQLLDNTDVLLVEADGSKMLPLKYPNATEPVLPKQTDEVLVICGLSAVNRSLETVCHRLTLAREAVHDLGTVADEKTIAKILWSGYGSLNPIFILNQADTDAATASGNRIKQYLTDMGAKAVNVISLKNMGFASERYF